MIFSDVFRGNRNQLIRLNSLHIISEIKQILWRRVVVFITTAQLQLTKFELRFCAGLNPACSVSEIGNGEDL